MSESWKFAGIGRPLWLRSSCAIRRVLMQPRKAVPERAGEALTPGDVARMARRAATARVNHLVGKNGTAGESAAGHQLQHAADRAGRFRRRFLDHEADAVLIAFDARDA